MPHSGGTLATSLRSNGYLVLEAQNASDALSFVRMHSRPIHVLLMSVSFGNSLAQLLQQYRQGIGILWIGRDDTQPDDVSTPELALERVRHFFHEGQEPASHSIERVTRKHFPGMLEGTLFVGRRPPRRSRPPARKPVDKWLPSAGTMAV
jgi:hypothetical protein